MAKQCMMRREKRRTALVVKNSEKRAKYKAVIKDPEASLADKEAAQKVLQTMPRDSAEVRRRNRCWKTGRAKGVYSFVGLCRNMFRLHAMQGDLPGIRKSSW